MGNGVETRYNYDPIMQRLAATNTDTPAGAGGPIQRLTYQYNSVGNVVGINTPPTPNAPKLANVSQGFFYDDLDQLTYAWGWGVNNSSGQSRYYSLSMGYDGIGNIQSKSQYDWATNSQGAWNPVAHTTYTNNYQYSASHPHRVTQVGAQTFGFDLNGNQVNSQGGGEPTRLMQWDEDDRLTSVIQDNKQVTFRYDASGTRTHRSSTNGVFQYANQWYSVRNGSLATKHIFAGGTRVASVIGEGSNELRVFYHSDHLGSTQLVTNASGQVREHYEQIPFGEPWIEEVAQTDNNAVHRFTGKELDPETGMYYFDARYYEPRMSQWISVDPALGSYLNGEPAGGVFVPANLAVNSYSHNSPIRVSDPNGLTAQFVFEHDRIVGHLELTPTMSTDDRVGISIRGVFPENEFAFVQTWNSEVEVVGENASGASASSFVQMQLNIEGVRSPRTSGLPGFAPEYVDIREGWVSSSPLYERLLGFAIWNEMADFPDNRLHSAGSASAAHSFGAFETAASVATASQPRGAGQEQLTGANYVAIRTNFTVHAVTESGQVLASQRWRHTQYLGIRPDPRKPGTTPSLTTIVEVVTGIDRGQPPLTTLHNALEQMARDEQRNGNTLNPLLQRLRDQAR